MDKWLLYVLVASNQFTCNGAEQKKGFRLGLVLKVAHNCFTKYTTQYDAMESTGCPFSFWRVAVTD